MSHSGRIAGLGFCNRQAVLFARIRKGLAREAAYQRVQDTAMKIWEVKPAGRDDADFVEVLKADPAVAKHFKPGELEQLCSLDFHFKEVNSRFKKHGPVVMLADWTNLTMKMFPLGLALVASRCSIL